MVSKPGATPRVANVVDRLQAVHRCRGPQHPDQLPSDISVAAYQLGDDVAHDDDPRTGDLSARSHEQYLSRAKNRLAQLASGACSDHRHLPSTTGKTRCRPSMAWGGSCEQGAETLRYRRAGRGILAGLSDRLNLAEAWPSGSTSSRGLDIGYHRNVDDDPIAG